MAGRRDRALGGRLTTHSRDGAARHCFGFRNRGDFQSSSQWERRNLTIDDDALDHELTLVRIAENESAFRAANERIEAGAESAGIVTAVPFICECPRRRCTEIVRMTLDEYEDVRAHPVRFFTIPGHQDLAESAGAAHVVEERNGYVLADKIGVAGEIARERYDSLAEDDASNLDPDSRGQSEERDA